MHRSRSPLRRRALRRQQRHHEGRPAAVDDLDDGHHAVVLVHQHVAVEHERARVVAERDANRDRLARRHGDRVGPLRLALQRLAVLTDDLVVVDVQMEASRHDIARWSYCRSVTRRYRCV